MAPARKQVVKKTTAGRPTLYRPEYCDELVAFCRQGFSITGFAGEIGVCRETISEWASVHPEFSVAVKRAKAAATRSYEGDALRVRSKGGGPGTATLIIFGLKNMAPDDYSDRPQERGEEAQDASPQKIEISIVDARKVNGDG